MLLCVNPGEVNGSPGEVEKSWLPGRGGLIELLDSPGFGNASAGADARPEQPEQDIALDYELVVDGLLGSGSALRPGMGFHRTGNRTTPPAAACWAFQSFITSDAASRSSVRSDREAMNARKTCASKVMACPRIGQNDSLPEPELPASKGRPACESGGLAGDTFARTANECQVHRRGIGAQHIGGGPEHCTSPCSPRCGNDRLFACECIFLVVR